MNGPFREAWVKLEDGQAMCALINGDVGWLMYLPCVGSPGFSSRNPDFHGSRDETIEFQMEHGQGDRYPAAWVLPVETVERVLEHFRRERKRPPFVTWHDDSLSDDG